MGDNLECEIIVNRSAFWCEIKFICAVASLQVSRQISGVNFNWEKLCTIAAAEIEATWNELPKPLRERAVKLPVTFQPHPNEDLQVDGSEVDTMGFFTGAEFVEGNDWPLPPQIILFLENIWDVAETNEKRFREEVRTTFLHELGHYLGLDEKELMDRGVGISLISWAF
jgi:predicted Zn-dependent protease with MMP-like domain